MTEDSTKRKASDESQSTPNKGGARKRKPKKETNKEADAAVKEAWKVQDRFGQHVLYAYIYIY